MIWIAHRKNVLGEGEWWDTLTNLGSGGLWRALRGKQGYSHTEVLFSDGTAMSALFTIAAGQCTRPVAGRVRGGPALFKRERYPDNLWDFTSLDITPSEEFNLRSWAHQQIDDSIADNGGYDRTGVLRFVIPWMRAHKKDWFCSEFSYQGVHEALSLLKDVRPEKVSPNMMVDLCAAAGLPLIKPSDLVSQTPKSCATCL